MTHPNSRMQPATDPPAWDLADRMRKALRVASMSGGEMANYLDVDRRTVTAGGSTATRNRRRSRCASEALRTGVPFEWILKGQVNAQANEHYLDRSPCPVYTLNTRRTGR